MTCCGRPLETGRYHNQPAKFCGYCSAIFDMRGNVIRGPVMEPLDPQEIYRKIIREVARCVS